MYTDWFGPAASAPVIDVGDGRAAARGSMSVESDVAYETALRWFAHVGRREPSVAAGIAWYLQSRVVEKAFDVAFLTPGYRYQTTCFFGCHVRWVIPALIVSRWSDGLGRVEFLRHETAREWPVVDRRRVAHLEKDSLALALTLASLERELGWPTLQGALRVAANPGDTRPFHQILADATARDLDAVFQAVSSGPSNHGLGAIVSGPGTECIEPRCQVTRVPIVRRGAVPFPLLLQVDFEDGTRIASPWNGTADVLTFESRAPAARVRLDPNRVWLLDTDYQDAEFTRAHETKVPVVKWVAWWMLWLQDAMLTHTFPV